MEMDYYLALASAFMVETGDYFFFAFDSNRSLTAFRSELGGVVNNASERKKAPALSNIGSMSPARLSLGTVASRQSQLLFYLAERL